MKDSAPAPTRPANGEAELRARLARAEARYRALVERIPAILYEDVPVDGELEASYVGPQVEDILGISVQAYMNHQLDEWADHLHPDDREHAVREYEEALAAGGPLVQEYRMVRPDGGIVWIRDEFVLVKDDDDELICVQGVMFDITELKEAQAAVARQVEMLRKVDLIGKEFTDLVLQGADLGRLLSALARIVRNPVVLEDAAHQVVEIARFGNASDLAAAWDAHSRDGHLEADSGTVHHDDGSPGCSWIPIVLRERSWGRLHVPEAEHALDEVDRLALDRAAAAIALTLHSEQYQSHLADHERGALMSDIWEGRFTSTREVLRRARRLGANFEGLTLSALVVEPANLAEVAGGELADAERRMIRAALSQETRAAFTDAGVDGLSAPVGDRVFAVVGAPHGGGNATSEVATILCERMTARLPELVIAVGVSGETDPGSLQRALARASEAAAYGVRDARKSGVFAFEELGIHHLLLRLADGPELAHFVESQLKPVLDHDARSGSPLLPTLRAFLAGGGRKAETARALHLERRSLYYRLERLERLLHKDLDDQEVRVQLEIAIRGLDLLRQRAGAQEGVRAT